MTISGPRVDPGVRGELKISGYSVPTHMSTDMIKKYTLASRRNWRNRVLGTKSKMLYRAVDMRLLQNCRFGSLTLAMTTFPIAWPSVFTALFQVGGAVTVLGQHLVNLKCMFPERSEAEVFYASQIAWAIIPIALLGACAATWHVIDLACGGQTASKEEEEDEEGEEGHTQQQQQLTLSQKISASMVALLYLVWPGLCSATFSLFACRSLCGETARTRLRADLGEFCFEGRHAAFAFGTGLPMLLLYVVGLPVGALLMVRRLRWRAARQNKRMEECKGHSTWGLFYSAFRDDTWW